MIGGGYIVTYLWTNQPKNTNTVSVADKKDSVTPNDKSSYCFHRLPMLFPPAVFGASVLSYLLCVVLRLSCLFQATWRAGKGSDVLLSS